MRRRKKRKDGNCLQLLLSAQRLRKWLCGERLLFQSGWRLRMWF